MTTPLRGFHTGYFHGPSWWLEGDNDLCHLRAAIDAAIAKDRDE